PDTEGAANASRLAQQLTDPSLALQTEEVVLPEENSKALITYRNVSKAYIRLYTNALPINPQQNRLTDEQRAQLLQTKPIRSWQQALPSAEDLHEHRAELKIDPLPVGSYILVASATPDFQLTKN